MGLFFYNKLDQQFDLLLVQTEAWSSWHGCIVLMVDEIVVERSIAACFVGQQSCGFVVLGSTISQKVALLQPAADHCIFAHLLRCLFMSFMAEISNQKTKGNTHIFFTCQIFSCVIQLGNRLKKLALKWFFLLAFPQDGVCCS